MPGAVADRAFVRLLYGTHPYGHTPLGTERALASLTIDDVRAFPSGDDAAVGGDARRGGRLRPPDDRAPRGGGVRRMGRRGGGRFRSARRAAAPARLNVVPRPGAPQSELRIGHVAVATEHARLPRARGGEHGARRPVRQPHQPESARGQGLHLRRAHGVRLPPAARALCAAGQRADGGDRAGDSGVARRDRGDSRSAAGHARRARARRRGADARLRAELRDRRAGRARA